MRHARPLTLAALLLAGCATGGSQVKSPTGKPQVIEMEPMKIEVVKAPEGQRVEAFDAATLFEQAGADLNQQKFKEAAAAYDRLVTDFADSRYSVAAYYNAGLALEGLKDYAGAAARYRALVEKHPGTHDALDALFRMGGCYAEVGNWAASADTFAQVLVYKDLSVGDRIEAMGRRGLAQYNMKDSITAERTFREAMNYYRANETVERLDSDFFLALCQYYLAEISHDTFRAMPVRLPEKQMKKDLEAKAEQLLVAQARYVDVARIRNPGWATAAGYQMATLYKEFYDALMDAPIPPQLTPEAKQVYTEELRKTIEPLLKKAIHAHELTQQVAERNGIDNEWVRKSNEQMEQLRALVAPPDVKDAPPLTPPPAAKPSPHRPENDKIQPPATPPRNDDYHPRVIL
jgi:TolA-binding protein